MLKLLRFILLTVALIATASMRAEEKDFMHVQGPNIVDSHGNKFFIKGTNLGNWLNPEGYMFGFNRTTSPHMIDLAVRELVGPVEAKKFWKAFKDNYITEDDFRFIASKGANTIRVPFNYRLFTYEDYMGMNDPEEGFRRLDDCVAWARKYSVRLILDMHDCPGGQTGDNIDDSYGYPWLMTEPDAQQQFMDIWTRIAKRYANEDVILGYELANEPVATYWEGDERKALNDALEPLYIRTVQAIRSVDPNHIVLLGGPQWNSEFGNFTNWTFDDNIMYTCHRYGGAPTADAIRSYIDFRDKTNLPMYMGELGHNSDKWLSDFATTMRDNNIGYTYWPYKKINDSSMTGVAEPDGWKEKIVAFVEAPRGSYGEIRQARNIVSQSEARDLLYRYVENAKADNMLIHDNYINSIQLDK